MTKWINRAVFKMPRNGATTRTVNTSSPTNLTAGAAFTPEAGSLLVAVVYGGVTTTTPAGWTLPSGGSAVQNGGLYVFHRVSDGTGTITFTHNADNYPVLVAVYEFAAGSSFVKAAMAVGVTYGGANPALAGLTGTNVVMAVKARTVPDADPYAYAWTAPTVEDFDVLEAFVATDGYSASLGYVEGFTGASWTPIATNAVPSGSYETITFAILATEYTAPPTPLDTPEVTASHTDPTTPGGTDGTITVTWAPVPNAARYEVGITTGHYQTTGFTQVAADASSPHIITGRAAGNYTVAVKAHP